MAKDYTHRTLTRSSSEENSLELPFEMLHPDGYSPATQDQSANGRGESAYFDVLLPAQGGPATKSQISAMVTESTGQCSIPDAVGSGSSVYFDVLLPKQGTAVEQERASPSVPQETYSDSMSRDVSSDNLEAHFSDDGSRTNSVAISERALSFSSVSSSNSVHASPVYENVAPRREKCRSVSPNCVSPPSSADVREEWILPRHRDKSLHQKRASFDELALLQQHGTGEHSSPVRHSHVADERATKSPIEPSLQRAKESSSPKRSARYVNLESVNEAICSITTGMGKVNVRGSTSRRSAHHATAATEYINVTVDKKRSSAPESYRKEEYVNVEFPNRLTKHHGRQSLGSRYVNVDDRVVQSAMAVSRRAEANNFVLMDFSGGSRQSMVQTNRQTDKRNKFSHARSRSCDNLVELTEDASDMRGTRSRSNALTEKCSPSFKRWKRFSSRDNLLESPLEKSPPTDPRRGTKGLNYVTIQHTPNPRKASSQSEEELVLSRKPATFKITGSRSASDVVYMQIDPIATRAIGQTMAQRNSEIATRMKMYSDKATTLS